jgi:hypothetical protein
MPFSTFQSKQRGIKCWLIHRLYFILFFWQQDIDVGTSFFSLSLSLFVSPESCSRLGKNLRGYISLHTYIHTPRAKKKTVLSADLHRSRSLNPEQLISQDGGHGLAHGGCVCVSVLAGMPDFHLSRFFFQFTFAASAFSLGRSKNLSTTFIVFLPILMTVRKTVDTICPRNNRTQILENAQNI